MISEFYAHPKMADGHLGKCKDCAKADVNKRLGELKHNPEWMAKERARCRNKIERARARAKANGIYLGPTKEDRDKAVAKYAKLNKHKIRARYIATNALRDGKLTKPESCEQCQSLGLKIVKHHPDYSEPLHVVWLCTKCHGIVHRK